MMVVNPPDSQEDILIDIAAALVDPKNSTKGTARGFACRGTRGLPWDPKIHGAMVDFVSKS